MATELFYGYITTTVSTDAVVDEINEKYAPALKSLLPSGRIWDFPIDSDAYALLRALAYSLSRVEIRGQDLLREFHPSTMNELLPDWERVLGLPGDNPIPPTTLAGRRGAVLAKLLGHGDPTNEFFENLAESLSYDGAVVISGLFKPFVAGSDAGSPLLNSEGGWPFAWLVLARTIGADDMLEWLIGSLTPAHTVALLSLVSAWWLYEPFITWTGDDPDGWVVTEDTGAQEITQVGSGESHGGSGTGACNIYSSDSSGTVEIEKTSTLVLNPAGSAWVCVVEISHMVGGPLYVRDTDSPSLFYEEIPKAGRYVFWFRSTNNSAHVAIGAESVAVDATVDQIRVIGYLSYMGSY